MNHRIKLMMLPLGAAAAIGTGCSGNKALSYPEAPSDNTVDVYFGTEVADPYRPLENDTAEATLEWVKAENAVTRKYMSQIPFRDSLSRRLTQLFDYPRVGVPERAADGRYYYYANSGLQNQSVIYRTDSVGRQGEVFLDPNTLSDNGTVALSGLFRSNVGKGRYTGYTISRNGSDWEEIYVMDTDSRELLPDHIEWAKFSEPHWLGEGFLYSAYPRPEEGKEYSNANENHQVYYHKLGTPQSADALIYENPSKPLHFHTSWVPDSEEYIFILGAGEGNGNSVIFRRADGKPDAWTVMEPSQDYEITPVDVVDGKILFITDYNAPNKRLMAADPKKPAKENWTEVIPEGEGVLTAVDLTGSDKMIVSYEQDASGRAYVYDRKGNRLGAVEFPTFGTAYFSTDKGSDEVYYSFTSFTYPSAVYSFDTATGASTLVSEPTIKGVDLDDYVTEQVFYPSADGTKIPMFLTYKKGIERNGKNPVYLYGYGGFNVSLPPGFSSQRLVWLENGGIYAQANLRGGSEYGEAWHQAGTKMNKLNVFNDFIAAAEYLIGEGYTSPDYLAIEGASNGGLLVGATVNLRPDLFKVALPGVGVMDMMRYHLFTIGWNWANDYGTSADSKEMADYLLGYSPLHTIRNDGTPYPAILVTTADHDDRVVPAHSFKYAATLQAADTGDAPKLISIQSDAGHGAGKPVSKLIGELADRYAFIFYNMGIDPTK